MLGSDVAEVLGMRENGIHEEFIEQMIQQMKGFAHYGFPESHAISFALIAYASSYLKCHHPAAFFTSVLNSQPMGFYSPHELLMAARKDGVKILPLDLHYSEIDHIIEKGSIRLGFRMINCISIL